jgi:hypothetical protein
MADAEDLKSSGDFSSCGFDSHPGHQFSIITDAEGLTSAPVSVSSGVGATGDCRVTC